MPDVPLAQGERHQPCELTLMLLSSPSKLGIIEALPGPDEPGITFGALLLARMGGPRPALSGDLAGLETLGLVTHTEGGLRCTRAVEDLALVRASLIEWSLGGRLMESERTRIPAAPALASAVRKIWTTDILVHLAIRPSSPKQVLEALPVFGLSTIKRYLYDGRGAGLLDKGVRGNRPSQYSLTRFGLLLIRPLCCALRFEERHLAEFTLPPSTQTLRAGMAVVAQLLRLAPGEDRVILFEVIDEEGEPIVIKHAVYRDGAFVSARLSFHDDALICIRGTRQAWYDLIIDGEIGGMQAINRGATTILRQVRREFRLENVPS